MGEDTTVTDLVSRMLLKFGKLNSPCVACVVSKLE